MVVHQVPAASSAAGRTRPALPVQRLLVPPHARRVPLGGAEVRRCPTSLSVHRALEPALEDERALLRLPASRWPARRSSGTPGGPPPPSTRSGTELLLRVLPGRKVMNGSRPTLAEVANMRGTFDLGARRRGDGHVVVDEGLRRLALSSLGPPRATPHHSPRDWDVARSRCLRPGSASCAAMIASSCASSFTRAALNAAVVSAGRGGGGVVIVDALFRNKRARSAALGPRSCWLVDTSKVTTRNAASDDHGLAPPPPSTSRSSGIRKVNYDPLRLQPPARTPCDDVRFSSTALESDADASN